MAKPFRRVSISGPQFFEEVLIPSFGDLVEGMDVRNGFFGEFQVLDDVAHERKIIDIRRLKNILKRRDASCATTFDPISRAGLRKITVTELGGAVKFCREEFYQGCLKDWRNGDPVFIDKIESFFRNAIATDLMSLMYFGDVDLPADNDPDHFNVNAFDGIITQYKKYLAAGKIPASQTFSIPQGTISAANAKVYLENLLSKQDMLMEHTPDNEKMIMLDKPLADAYEEYLISTNQVDSATANYVQDGIKVRAYKGVPIFVNPYFKPILSQVYGANTHLAILTLRGNFVFATDSNYGTGPNGDEALVVWYDWDEDVWKWKTALKAGTQIALPEHSVLALPQ